MSELIASKTAEAHQIQLMSSSMKKEQNKIEIPAGDSSNAEEDDEPDWVRDHAKKQIEREARDELELMVQRRRRKLEQIERIRKEERNLMDVFGRGNFKKMVRTSFQLYSGD